MKLKELDPLTTEYHILRELKHSFALTNPPRKSTVAKFYLRVLGLNYYILTASVMQSGISRYRQSQLLLFDFIHRTLMKSIQLFIQNLCC